MRLPVSQFIIRPAAHGVFYFLRLFRKEFFRGYFCREIPPEFPGLTGIFIHDKIIPAGILRV